MKLLYTFGIFAMTFLLIQFEILILLLIGIAFHYLDLDIIGDIAVIAVAAMIVVGHVITTNQSLKHLNESTDLEKDLEQKRDKNFMLNNPIALGLAWRLINEWKYIKRVAQLKFKKEKTT